MTTTKKRAPAVKFITPEGVAVFPKLNAPDTKFKAEGEYQCKLRLPAEESEAFIELIEAQLKAYWPIAKAELEQRVADAKTGKQKAESKKALDEMKEAEKPYKPAYDDDGNETGEYEFNIKTPASWLKDKGKATEKRMPIKPSIFDARGNALKNPPEIWGGSRLVVAGEFRPFNMPIGVGISLRLNAVQIIELSGGGGARDAAGFGFGKHEGGYEGSDEDQAPAKSSGPAEDGDQRPSPDDDF
ncbi:MAG: hypothetical protein GXC94_02225 [Comamonadaceae bacterium]|jgi:hypothetical protein|nr:hypothetical protein [Comamonadaceae bacterium]